MQLSMSMIVERSEEEPSLHERFCFSLGAEEGGGDYQTEKEFFVSLELSVHRGR